jgi:FixJ family two-component response regulator
MPVESLAAVGRSAAMPIKLSIALVGDNASVGAATTGLPGAQGFTGGAFSSANRFFTSDRLHIAACLIADTRMPGMGGVALDDELVVCGNGHVANERR